MRIANDLTQAIDYDEVATKRDQCVCEIIDHSIELNAMVNSVATPVKFVLLAKTVSQQPYRSAAIDPIATLRKRLLTTKKTASIPELLQTAFEDASEKFYQYQQQNTTGNKIGVSILLAAIVEQGEQAPHLYINHLGSCRAYLLRKGKLHPLTADHSYIRFLLDTGGASWETANKHSGKAELTNYLGLNRYEKGDTNLITPPEDGEVWSYRTKVNQQPTQSLKLEEEDKLIFVTSDPTDDGSKIRQVVEKSPEQAVNELIQQSITAAAIVYWEKPKFAWPNILGGKPHTKPQSQVASSSGKSRGVGIITFLGLLGVLLMFGYLIRNNWTLGGDPTPQPTATIALLPTNTKTEQGASPTVSVATVVSTETPVATETIPTVTSPEVTGTPITPAPTQTKGDTKTPTPIPPTSTPIPTATQTPVPQETTISSTATPTDSGTGLSSEEPAPELIKAEQREKQVVFVWTWSGIREGHQFEVSIFTKFESSQCIRKGAYDLAEVNKTLQQNGIQYSVSFDPINSEGVQGRSGEYLWCVTVLSNDINDNGIPSAKTQSFPFDANAGRSVSTPPPLPPPPPPPIKCGGPLNPCPTVAP